MLTNKHALKILSLMTSFIWIGDAQATAFQSITTPWAGLYPVVEPINPAYMLAASQDRALQKITLQEYSRAGNGVWSDFMREWRAIPYKEISSYENLLWIPQQSLIVGKELYLLVSGAECLDTSSCAIKQHALLRIKLEDKSLTSTVITPSCEAVKPPEMIGENSAFRINDGCNTLHIFEAGEERETITPSLSVIQFSKENAGILWGYDTKESSDIVAFHDSKSGIEIGKIDVQGKINRCVETLSKTPGEVTVNCDIKGDTKSSFVKITYSGSTDLQAIGEIAPELSTYATVSEHRYVQLSSDKNHYFLNTKAESLKDIYSQRELPSQKLSSHLSKLQKKPEAKTEPTSNFYVVFPVTQGFERVSFIMYDVLSENFGPFITSTTTFTLPSGSDIEIPWKIMDEETLPADLKISDDGAPKWLAFNPASRNAMASPKHADSGKAIFKQSISDGKNDVEVPWDITVSLSPFEVMVFEPYWFEQWKIDKPVPYAVLLQQIKSLPILEDKPFQWKFSVVGRASSEFTFESTPPVFMKTQLNTEPLSFTFNGVAEQSNVGEYTVILTAKDLYANEPAEISVPFKVSEIDEPFKIISIPVSTLKTDELYTYKLEIKDEESTIEEMQIFPINIPGFLQVDTKSKTFSGTPTRKDVGTHTVSVAVVDNGGHRMVHQWAIVVTETQNESAGGSVGAWSLLFMSLIAAGRRFFK